ncbi:MAG TPA: DUF460 domain-containing protein [Candidatus Nanoarchaeia archaeon]|nr:DUF460 domain-containing protein [Candidatus Nanoarchaeia archaeon]
MKLQQDLIIVGIDPGITTAYAVLDSKGNIRKLKSSKELALNNLLAEVTDEGKVLVIGTDVKHIPGLIEKFSAKVGAKVVMPEEDMKVGFKERITKEYNPRDDHQRDALAAALYAFKEVKPALQKVDDTLKRIGKEHLSREVKVKVLEGCTIGNALASLEQPEDEEIIKKRRLKTAFKKSSRMIEENRYLKKENDWLMAKAEYLDQKIRQLLKKVDAISERKVQDIIKFKNQKIEFLNQEVGRYKQEVNTLRQEVKSLTPLVLEARGKIVAKKLKTLGWEEVQRTVEEGDILVVDDVNVFSERSLEFLKKKTNIIIYKKQPAKELVKLGISFLNAVHIPMKETTNIAIIEQEAIERERKKIYSQRLCKSTRKSVNHLSRSPR